MIEDNITKKIRLTGLLLKLEVIVSKHNKNSFMQLIYSPSLYFIYYPNGWNPSEILRKSSIVHLSIYAPNTIDNYPKTSIDKALKSFTKLITEYELMEIEQ